MFFFSNAGVRSSADGDTQQPEKLRTVDGRHLDQLINVYLLWHAEGIYITIVVVTNFGAYFQPDPIYVRLLSDGPI
jgi:hypothetical protein